MFHFSSNFSTYPLMILSRQKKEASLSLSNPSLSSYTLASFQTQFLLFHNSQYPFTPKLESWTLKICISLYTLFSSSLKPTSVRCLLPPATMFSSVKFSHSVVSNSLWPQGLQHTRLPCPSPMPRAYSDSCASRWWCHPTISSSVVPFSSCHQSFPASGSFPMSQFFASGGQSIGESALASILPMNIQDWFPLAS